MKSIGYFGITLLLLLVPGITIVGCGSEKQDKANMNQTARREINIVKDEHAAELMAITGVVGVYVGALDDGTPCIGVMVVKKTPDLEKKIPTDLEGYPIKIDETGKIKPLR